MLVVLRRTPPGPTRGPSSVAPPDIFSQGAGNSRDQFAGQGSGENVRIELADRQDSSRVAMVILAKRIDPLEGRRYAVVEPIAYRFFSDGRVMHVRANTGKFTWPSRDQPPEQGTFEGDVKATLYEAGFALGNDPAKAVVIGHAEFDQKLDFDTTFGEAITPGRVNGSYGDIVFSGESVRVLFDEAREGAQLVLVERKPNFSKLAALIAKTAPALEPAKVGAGASPKGEVIAAAPEKATSEKATPPTGAIAAKPGAAKPKAPIETLYRAVYSSPLTFTSGAMRVDAAKGEGFVRLINNALPPKALAEIAVKGAQDKTKDPVPAPGEPSAAKGNEADSAGPAAPANPTNPANPATPAVTPAAAPDATVGGRRAVEWTLASEGSLEIRPLSAPGAELISNDVTIKLRGGEKPVEFTNAATHQSGHAPEVDYSATRGDLLMRSNASGGVAFFGASGEVVNCTDLGINLPTRVGQTRGLGDMLAGSRTNPRGASWSEQADFEFFPGTADWKIRNVMLAGNTKAWDGNSAVGGDVLRAEFDMGGQFKNAHVAGNGLAQDGRGGEVRGDTLDVAFKPAQDGKSEPSVVTATGHALASRGTDVLSAGLIEATMGKGKDAKHTATSVLARDSVTFTGKDSLSAGADELRADVLSERVVLLGKSAFAAKGPTRVDGEVIKLSRASERIDVEGPGRFAHSGQTAGADAGGVVAATSQWAQSMSFDNVSGILEARGSTHSEIMPDTMTIDKIDADFIRVEIEPLAVKDPQSSLPGPAQDQRKVIKAVARAAPDRPEIATVESRKYDTVVELGKTGKAGVEQLVYLEGREILADLALGTLDVPGKGRSVVLDRRVTQGATPQPGPAGPLGGSSRGTALFDWAGSMHYTRRTGDLTFLGGAQLTHAREADGSTVYLEAQRVDAVVLGTDKPGSSGGVQRGRLTKATGTGAVFGKLKSATGERQLTSDRFLYDADLGTVRAWADESAEIIVYDSTTASPVRAAEILWDLARDRVEVVKPSTIVAPR